MTIHIERKEYLLSQNATPEYKDIVGNFIV